MHRVAIYVRLSKEDEGKNENESESIVNQKNMLISYAQEKDWEIYKIYSDEDYSGSDSTRPEFNEMLQDAKSKKFDIILCKSLSRFARDVALVETYINDKFLEWGIRFISPTDYADSNSKGSRKNIQINSLVNQWYLEDLSENIRSVLKYKKQQGQFLSALPPYGYKKDPNDKHKLIKDDNVSEVVETIFKLAISEHTIMSIVKHLNNIGYINPSTYFIEQGWAKQKKAYNTNWGSSTIKLFLHNRVYTGDLVLNVSGKKTYKSKRATKRPKEEWIIHENTHEPYISKDDFYKIQKMLQNRSNFYTTKTTGTPNYFKGIIFCGECGGTLTLQVHNTSNEKSIYYRCARSERGVTMCSGTRIKQDWINETLIKEIRKIIDYILKNKEMPYIHQDKKMDVNIKANIQSLNSRLEKFNNTLAAVYMEKAEGKITQDEYNIIRIGIIKNISDVKIQLESEEERLFEITRIESESNSIFNFIKEHKNFEKLTREIVKVFVKKITVKKRNSKKHFDYNVDFEFKI